MAYGGGDPWRIVLLGKTGVGKSASGNTILGERLFKSESNATSVTTYCSEQMREVEGRTITVIDTPGLYDTKMSKEEIVKEIVNGIRMVAPGPHAFLLVIDLKRFTEEEKNTVRNFQKIFGEGVHKHMIVLFTRGDDLEYDNKTIETYISQAGQDLRNLISSCGGRYHVFNNRKEDRTQVKELLQKVHSMLKINCFMYYNYELFTLANLVNDERESKEARDKRIAELEEKVEKIQHEKHIHFHLCLLM